MNESVCVCWSSDRATHCWSRLMVVFQLSQTCVVDGKSAHTHRNVLWTIEFWHKALTKLWVTILIFVVCMSQNLQNANLLNYRTLQTIFYQADFTWCKLRTLLLQYNVLKNTLLGSSRQHSETCHTYVSLASLRAERIFKSWAVMCKTTERFIVAEKDEAS